MAELGCLVQVVGALRSLHVLFQLLDLFARLSYFADRFSLRIPLRLELAVAIFEIGELLT